MTLAIVSIVAIAANVALAWLIGRKPPEVYVTLNCCDCYDDEGDDPDEDELEPDVLPDEERTEADGMRLN